MGDAIQSSFRPCTTARSEKSAFISIRNSLLHENMGNDPDGRNCADYRKQFCSGIGLLK
jgi:hypothetical protein